MTSIEGIWHSRYEYGQGTDNLPQFSEHRIEFTQEGDTFVGRSLPNSEGSEVTITLRRHGVQFAGEWTERTSTTGHYKGREFTGLILLLLQNEDSELTGMWLGAGSSELRVKAGPWTLKRVMDS